MTAPQAAMPPAMNALGSWSVCDSAGSAGAAGRPPRRNTPESRRHSCPGPDAPALARALSLFLFTWPQGLVSRSRVGAIACVSLWIYRYAILTVGTRLARSGRGAFCTDALLSLPGQEDSQNAVVHEGNKRKPPDSRGQEASGWGRCDRGESPVQREFAEGGLGRMGETLFEKCLTAIGALAAGFSATKSAARVPIRSWGLQISACPVGPGTWRA